jgi:hypothetical protein
VILLAIISASLMAIFVLWVTIVLAAVIVRDSHYVARHAAPARNSYRGTKLIRPRPRPQTPGRQAPRATGRR